jgi:hypothetical protein
MTDLFADFAVPADLTGKCYITHPATKKRLRADDGSECYLELRGWHSSVAQEFRFEREERLRRLGREMTGEEAYEDLGDLCAQLTASWNLVTPTGKKLDIECSYENARKLFNSLDHRWMRQQAIDFLNNEANFLPSSWLH